MSTLISNIFDNKKFRDLSGQNFVDSDAAIKAGNLNWKVAKQQLFLDDGTLVPNTYANVREDNNEILGIVTDKYKLVQNSEAFDFCNEIINNTLGIKCEYEFAGSLNGGKRTFMFIRLPAIKVAGDEIVNYLAISNSHDGSTGLIASIINIRVACTNVLQLALKTCHRIFYLRHSKNIDKRMYTAADLLNSTLEYNDSFIKNAEILARIKIDPEKFYVLLKHKLPYMDKNKDLIIENIRNIHNTKPDLTNLKGTAWGLYNAVADYATHSKPFRSGVNSEDGRMSKIIDSFPILTLSQSLLRYAA